MNKIVSTFFLFGLLGVSYLFGQAQDGNILGAVLDPSGSAIPGATVELENVATAVKTTSKTDEAGLYRFNNVLIGTYSITVNAQGFAASSLKNVIVELNKATTANITLQVGTVATTMVVNEASQLIDTTTAQVANNYQSRFAAQLPSAANAAGGVLNLSLLGAGVVSAGGYGTAEGPSVGGQRPRNNNFMIEGSDNNRKDVTGSVAKVPPDAVLEFTVLQNQFSAEFGHSSGGQFNSVIRGGTNELHGSLFEYLENRKLNALDQNFKRQGILSRPRSDSNRLGGSVGGPAIKNRLFYYGLFQYSPTGEVAANAAPIYSPTAAGWSTLSSLSGISSTNLNVLKQYLPAAATQDGTRSITVLGNTIPLGIVPVVKPAFENRYDWLVSVDYSISDKDQLRARYVDNKIDTTDTTAHLPVFFVPRPITTKLFTLTEFHNFRPALTNEFRAAMNRYNSDIPIPGIEFPGLDVFPNVQLTQQLNLNLGPNQSAPQATIQTTYQLQDNLSWTKGKHDLKFGIDGRQLKGASTFIQRLRGDYTYSTVERYLRDLVPDNIAQRNNGSLPYSADAWALYWFANDNWKVNRNLAINLGVRYEFNSVPQSMHEFDLNKIADVPGVLTFAAPRPQKWNFAPRLGVAYTPGTDARTTVRAGFGIAYDQVFNNVGTNSRPPQATSTVDRPVSDTPGFLAGGGIKPTEVAAARTAAGARAATSSWLGDQKQGYSINWNLGIQRVFGKDYTVEARYLGNRGVHLLYQNQLNRIAIVTPDHQLPTYLQAPSQATLDALPLTLASLTAERNARGNIFAPYGFTSNITAYLPIGNSSYHGLALDVNKRYARNFLMKVGYTWSHTIDDSTAEVFSTVLTPRRAQDFFNRDAERGSSLLDRRQRFVFTWIYETPWFKTGAMKWFLGGYSVAGTYTAESPQWATVQSGVDSNMNGDSAADRAILNTAGVPGTSSDVRALTNSAGATVAYLALNPDAQFIRAQVGTYANAGKNLLPTKGINNWDVTLAKNLNFTERWRLNLRADFRNTFNHPQYAPGQINNVNFRSGLTNTTSYLTPGNPDFGKFDRVFRSNARVIQVGAILRF
jgi:carboxypeptidase family protein